MHASCLLPPPVAHEFYLPRSAYPSLIVHIHHAVRPGAPGQWLGGAGSGLPCQRPPPLRRRRYARVRGDGHPRRRARHQGLSWHPCGLRCDPSGCRVVLGCHCAAWGDARYAAARCYSSNGGCVGLLLFVFLLAAGVVAEMRSPTLAGHLCSCFSALRCPDPVGYSGTHFALEGAGTCGTFHFPWPACVASVVESVALRVE